MGAKCSVEPGFKEYKKRNKLGGGYLTCRKS